MLLSKELSLIGIDNKCINEKEFSSLGLAGYNDGKDVCTFIADAKYASELSQGISMVITTEEVSKELNGDYGICMVDNPRITFFKLHQSLSTKEGYAREQYDTIIAPSAKISPLAHIADKNVTIGENVIIEEFVSIKENTIIKDNCIIHSGTVVSSTGFEHIKNGSEIIDINHIGGVIVENNVEINANNTIDRAIYPWDNTIIGEKCRTGNLVQIAHGVKVGSETLVTSHSSISGRVIIGNNVWIGPGCIIRNAVSIGNNARVNMGSVVTLSVEEGQAVSGNFAIPHSIFMNNLKGMK